MRARLVVSLLALSVAIPSIASAQQVYKWKDASGAVHFSDKPPPAGVTVLQGSKSSAPLTAGPPGCRPDISAADCAAATAALRRDAADLEASSRTSPADDRAATTTVEDARLAAVYARECAEQRAALGALRQRASGGSNEIMTPEEIAALPARIADSERYLAANCKP